MRCRRKISRTFFARWHDRPARRRPSPGRSASPRSAAAESGSAAGPATGASTPPARSGPGKAEQQRPHQGPVSKELPRLRSSFGNRRSATSEVSAGAIIKRHRPAATPPRSAASPCKDHDQRHQYRLSEPPRRRARASQSRQGLDDQRGGLQPAFAPTRAPDPSTDNPSPSDRPDHQHQGQEGQARSHAGGRNKRPRARMSRETGSCRKHNGGRSGAVRCP
jgi:hypothetical protein